MPPPAFSVPEPLGPQHEIAHFQNGRHASLDEWLRHRARASEGLSARTYVTCAREAPRRVVGYYAISTAAAHRTAMPSALLRKGMPQEVPILLLGRLAIDAPFQGQGLGSALLADALRRCAAASAIAGVRAVIAHAIDDAAVQFYLRHGFRIAPQLDERTVLMPIEGVRSVVGV